MDAFPKMNAFTKRNIKKKNYLEYPWNFFGICSVHVGLGDRSNMEEFAASSEKYKKENINNMKICSVFSRLHCYGCFVLCAVNKMYESNHFWLKSFL